MIGAGLRKGETEFYWDGPYGFVLKSGISANIEQMAEEDKQLVDLRMTPKHHSALDDMQIFQEDLRRIKFIKCNASAYDFTPDILNGEIQLEYVACPERGNCKQEGELCQPLVIHGVKITMAELKITSLIRQCKYDKEICDILGIAPQTLRTHKQSIERKLNADRKVQVALKAVEYGIY